MLPSLLFSVSFLSPCFFLYLLGSFEVTVTSVSLPPFVSRRGLSNTNQRLSQAKTNQRLSQVQSESEPGGFGVSPPLDSTFSLATLTVLYPVQEVDRATLRA